MVKHILSMRTCYYSILIFGQGIGRTFLRPSIRTFRWLCSRVHFSKAEWTSRRIVWADGVVTSCARRGAWCLLDNLDEADACVTQCGAFATPKSNMISNS